MYKEAKIKHVLSIKVNQLSLNSTLTCSSDSYFLLSIFKTDNGGHTVVIDGFNKTNHPYFSTHVHNGLRNWYIFPKVIKLLTLLPFRGKLANQLWSTLENDNLQNCWLLPWSYPQYFIGNRGITWLIISNHWLMGWE